LELLDDDDPARLLILQALLIVRKSRGEGTHR
jgi:hypothetical protein